MSSKQLGEWLDWVEKTVLVWTILGLAILGFIQVITRYIFHFSFTWYEEMGSYLGVLITFLGASIGVRSGSHFTMDLFVAKLGRPWQQLLRCGTGLLCTAFCFLVVYCSIKIIARLHGYGTTSPAMQLPLYIAYLPIPIFSTSMGIRFGLQGLTSIGELKTTSSSTHEEAKQ